MERALKALFKSTARGSFCLCRARETFSEEFESSLRFDTFRYIDGVEYQRKSSSDSSKRRRLAIQSSGGDPDESKDVSFGLNQTKVKYCPREKRTDCGKAELFP